MLDNGGYRAAIESGRPDRRELFTAADGTELHWPDGARYVARKLSAYSA
ncbi:hypothetical protein ACH347_01225 [Saccharopolyspora sp. 5N102]